MASFDIGARAFAVLAAFAGLSIGPVGAETTVRLLRSTSGSRGTMQGTRYVIEDPRSVFSPAEDRQVIVLFEWEGSPGTHHCEGRWKDPSGKVVLSAPIDYQATSKRFGLYWTLALPETAARGLWAVEAFVDGAPAGTHTFEVTGSALAAPGRRSLNPGEIYQRAITSVATIERLGPRGELLGQGPAVALGVDHLVAAFPSIEGATTLRLRTAAGPRLESPEIGEWDRKQGFAVLRFPGHGLPALARSPSPLVVGDHCFVLDSLEDGSWVISDASVVGQEPPPAGRPRLNGSVSAGAPVLDERGDLAGIVAAAGSEEMLGPGVTTFAASGLPRAERGTVVVAVDRLPTASTARHSLAELLARGQFLRPLSPDQRHVISGVFAARVQRGGPVPMPEDQRFTFSRREGQASVFIQWNPQEKKDVMTRFQLYDSDSRTVVAGEPTKLKLRPRELFFTTWTMDVSRVPPGVYRVDLLLGDEPAWRGYLRITE